MSSSTTTTAASSTGTTAPDNTSMASNRSTLKDFLASIATIRGDLSNITAPPFVLSPLSTVELPQFWATRPDVFAAPGAAAGAAAATGGGAERRMMQVLRWWISSLRGQQYAGRDPSDGVKKPLNAVLGEVFVASWGGSSSSSPPSGSKDNGGLGTTYLVSEQVSHHPPVTACRVWNDAAGVEAEGFTRQEITFTGGGVNIKQMGYALYRLRNVGAGPEGETYLIPLPDVKVKGVLGGTPYPELGGSYVIGCTSGWAASVEFTGKGFLGLGGGDRKHGLEAKVYREGEERNPVYTVSGNWDAEFSVTDERSGEVVERFDVANAPVQMAQTLALEAQDPYETGRVWRGVRDALRRGDMQGVSDAKNRVEEGQREMRKQEEARGTTWERVFFKDVGADAVGEELVRKVGGGWNKAQTVGVWKFDTEAWEQRKRPFHAGLRPDNTVEDGARAADPQASGGSPADAGGSTQAGGAASAAAVVAGGQQTAGPPSSDSATPAGTTETVHPPLPPGQQQQEVEEARLADGVGDLSVQEQTAVEEMLRDQYSSATARKHGKKK